MWRASWNVYEAVSAPGGGLNEQRKHPSQAIGARRSAGPMTGDPGRRSRATEMMNRRDERVALDQMIDEVRAGQSRALVIRGDPGVGKTVLVDYLAGRASGSGCGWAAR